VYVHNQATYLGAQNPLSNCPPSPERYVARTELAAIMGVSVATIDRMAAAGMPSVTWGDVHAVSGRLRRSHGRSFRSRAA
jgi:hypothetical protein